MVFRMGRSSLGKRQTTQHWIIGAEASLKSHFVPWVNNLNLAELVGPDIPASSLDHYRLIPLTSRPDHVLLGAPEQSNFTLPAGITVTKTKHEPLHLDTPHAIGLVYMDKLQAVSAAYLSALGGLVIKQNQAAVGQRNSGLYGGFSWQDPLVRGWVAIGENLHVPETTILGSRNNAWATKLGMQILKQELLACGQEPPVPLTEEYITEAHAKGAVALAKHYDVVADRLGFTPLPSGNWQLDLASQNGANFSG